MDTINIAFNINDKYVPYWGVCLASLLLNTTKEDKIHVILLGPSISEENKRKIESLKKLKYFTLEYHQINSSAIKQMPQSSQQHISPETNYRLLLSSEKPELKKCIFLDADLVVVRNIRLLWEQNIENFYLAAVEDEAGAQQNSWAKSLPLPSGFRYANTGVSLFNLQKWREDQIEKNFFTNISKYNHLLKFPDQDILNITLAKGIKYLSPIFNAMPVQTYRNEKFRQQAFVNPVIIHFAGNRKPWDVPSRPYADLFWRYARQTPFYEELIFRMTQSQLRLLERKMEEKFSSRFLLFKKYYIYKILSKLTWGKKRAHYKQKRDALHEQVREIRRFLKN